MYVRSRTMCASRTQAVLQTWRCVCVERGECVCVRVCVCGGGEGRGVCALDRGLDLARRLAWLTMCIG